MAWDLPTAKALLGIAEADVSHDIALTSNLNIILALCENRTGRGLLYKEQVEEFYNVNTRHIRLSRFPIWNILYINGEEPKSDLIVQNRVGWIDISAYNRDVVTIQYFGGFDPLPNDLEAAMWEMFITRWNTINQVTGGPNLSGGGATVVQGSGDISRISLADFGSISFDVGARQVGGSQSDQERNATWGWLAPWAPILLYYCTESAPGVAFA